MDKVACIRNQQEKEPLFQRKFKPANSEEIFIIKSPNIFISKIDIPKDKEKPNGKNSRKKRFPKSDKMHPFLLKTEKKRNDKA